MTPQPSTIEGSRPAYTPLSLLLPHLDAVVTQGGTSILPALSAALPLLDDPQGADQFHNARACVASGADLQLLPGHVHPRAVREAVRRLLTEADFSRAAGALQDQILAMPGPEMAVGLLERLATDGQTIFGPAAGSAARDPCQSSSDHP